MCFMFLSVSAKGFNLLPSDFQGSRFSVEVPALGIANPGCLLLFARVDCVYELDLGTWVCHSPD